MYDLFEGEREIDQGRVIIPQFMYLKGALTREVAKVVTYYQTWPTTLPNEHLLVKLLLNLNVSMKRELQNYVDIASEMGYQVASQLRLTSSVNYGRVFSPGVFYGRACSEILIAHDSPFDIYDADVNWRELQPIVVHRHPFTDLNLARPMGEGNKHEPGIAVISINIPMLAVMWRGWWRDERKPDPSQPARRTHHFLSMYPITNMLYSQTDIALFNRMVALYDLEDVAPFKRLHSFFTYDYTDRADEYLEKQLELLRRTPMTFDHMLSAIPSLFAKDLREASQLPAVIPTRQVVWGLVIARIALVRFLVHINAYTENAKNRGYLNKIRQSLGRVRIDRVLETTLPNDVLQDVDRTIHRDIESYL